MNPRRRLIVPAVAVATAIALAGGCGGDDDDSGAQQEPGTTTVPAPEPTEPAETSTTAAEPASYEPCELVTKAEAEAVMGTTLQDGVPTGTPGDNGCMYTAPPEGSVAQLEIAVGPGAKKFYDIDKQNLGHEFTPVTGIGDEADMEEGTIFFRVGTTWASIRIVTLDDWEIYRPRVEELARTVASRMR
jgi:hypothetical protein